MIGRVFVNLAHMGRSLAVALPLLRLTLLHFLRELWKNGQNITNNAQVGNRKDGCDYDDNVHNRPLRSIAGLFQQIARDDESLDLVRAFIDLRDLCVTQHALSRVLFHVPIPAQDLDGVIGDFHCHIRSERFGHC